MDKRIEHVYIKKRDETDEDILSVLGEVCGLIEMKRQGGRGVLLHCAMGVSRSATVMAGYGMFLRCFLTDPVSSLSRSLPPTKKPRNLYISFNVFHW